MQFCISCSYGNLHIFENTLSLSSSLTAPPPSAPHKKISHKIEIMLLLRALSYDLMIHNNYLTTTIHFQSNLKILTKQATPSVEVRCFYLLIKKSTNRLTHHIIFFILHEYLFGITMAYYSILQYTVPVVLFVISYFKTRLAYSIDIGLLE